MTHERKISAALVASTISGTTAADDLMWRLVFEYSSSLACDSERAYAPFVPLS